MKTSKEIGVKSIPRTQLMGNKYNPRKRFDTAKMRNLKQSIENIGLIQPLLVRPIGKDKYEVVAGMRRFMATKGLSSIPCYIRELDDNNAKLLALTENLERADLSPIEEARAMANYLNYTPSSEIDEIKSSILNSTITTKGRKPKEEPSLGARIADLATKIPPQEITIRKRLSLLDLPEKIQIMVDNGDINLIEAETIVSLKEIVDIKVTALPDGLTDEEKVKAYQKAWKDCHNSMWSISQNMPKKADSKYADIPALKSIINQTKTDIGRESTARSEQQKALQSRFDTAKTSLLDSLVKIEEDVTLQDILEYDFDEEFGDLMDKDRDTNKEEWDIIKKKSKELLDKCEKKLTSIGDKESKEIREIKSKSEEEMDRAMITKRIVRQEVIDYCPHCGAGIEMDNLNKRISDANSKIEELNKRESFLVNEVKTLNTTANTLKRLRGDYKQRLIALLAITESTSDGR